MLVGKSPKNGMGDMGCFPPARPLHATSSLELRKKRASSCPSALRSPTTSNSAPNANPTQKPHIEGIYEALGRQASVIVSRQKGQSLQRKAQAS